MTHTSVEANSNVVVVVVGELGSSGQSLGY